MITNNNVNNSNTRNKSAENDVVFPMEQWQD